MFSTLRRIISNKLPPGQEVTNPLSPPNATQPPETSAQKSSTMDWSYSGDENSNGGSTITQSPLDNQAMAESSKTPGHSREATLASNQGASDPGNPGPLIRGGLTFEQICAMAYRNRGRPDHVYPRGYLIGLTFEEMSIVSYCKRIPLDRGLFIPLYFCVFCENQGCTGVFHQREQHEDPTPEALKKFIDATHRGKIRLRECEEQIFGNAVHSSSHSFVIEKERDVPRRRYWVVPSPTDEGWYLQKPIDDWIYPTSNRFDMKWHSKRLHCPYCDLDRPSYWLVAMYTPKTERT